jgi:hypothetical protein
LGFGAVTSGQRSGRIHLNPTYTIVFLREGH